MRGGVVSCVEGTGISSVEWARVRWNDPRAGGVAHEEVE